MSEQLQYLFNYLENVVLWRISNPSEDFKSKGPKFEIIDFKGSPLGHFIVNKKLSNQEIVVLLMALMPRLKIDLLSEINKVLIKDKRVQKLLDQLVP